MDRTNMFINMRPYFIHGDYEMKITRTKAKQIVKEFGGWASIDGIIHEDGRVTESYTFFGIDKQKVIAKGRTMKLGTLEKTHYNGKMSLKGENYRFYDVARCKIVGYEEHIVPELLEKIPIYDCKDTKA